MFLLFASGVLLGVLLVLWPLYRARQQAMLLEEERQQVIRDRRSMVDFMRLMAKALGESLTRQELNQRIVHASILGTGASSACMFECTPQSTMRGVAVEGLFPPHRPLTNEGAKTTTRAKFIEQVLQSEEIPIGEGIVGQVALSRKGELLANAAGDARVVKHADPALIVRSVIAVPLSFRDEFFGVLAVANPIGDRPFTEMDFSLLQSLAAQAALALHKVELIPNARVS